MGDWRSGLVVCAALCLPVTGGAAASELPQCGRGGLVDAEFRDAALRTLRQLVLHAPGQAAHGAVRASAAHGHVDPQGGRWHHVSAYQANLALAQALQIAPGLAGTAADWLRWQARHTTSTGTRQGVVFDHWVRERDLQVAPCPPGLALASCPQVDAYDSTAASLLVLAGAYAERVPDPSLLRETALRSALQAAAGTLSALTQPTGLTAAKPGYPVAFLMDAVEVAAGWRAWSHVQQAVYGDAAGAQASLTAARRVDSGIRVQLWDAGSRSWRVSLGADAPEFARWYPDSVAQAWPLLWGMGTEAGASSAFAHARRQDAWRQAQAAWRGVRDWTRQPVDPDGFLWPAAAVAARCVGDEAAARAWVAHARAEWLRADAPFAWPFHVGDLRWLLWMADPLSGPALPGGAASSSVR